MENQQEINRRFEVPASVDQQACWWLKENTWLKKIAREMDNIPIETADDKILTPVKMARQATYDDECAFFIPYGPHGVGKSAYMAKCLSQAYQTWDPEVLKKFIIWKPEMFENLLDFVEKEDKEYIMLACDDAGLWLDALRWNHPLLAAIGEYFDVIRTHFHSVILTSPWPMNIIKRIRGVPQAITIHIVKAAGSPHYRTKPREARGYRMYRLPDMRRFGAQPLFRDHFFAIMPEKFFQWYKPARRGFTSQAYKNVSQKIRDYRKEQEAAEKAGLVSAEPSKYELV